MTRWFYAIPALSSSLFLLLVWCRHRTLWHPATVPVGLYLVSGIVALLLDPETLTGFGLDHTWQMLTGYSALLLAALTPGLALRRIRRPNVSQSIIFRTVMLVLIPLAWYSLIYQLPYALVSLHAGADTVRVQINTEGLEVLPSSPLTTIAAVAAQFYPVYTLALVEGYLRGRSAFYLLSCAAGALCVVINGMCFMARDAFLWLIMSCWITASLYSRALGPEAPLYGGRL